MVDTAENIWRDFVTDGVPSTGPNKPKKSKIREWGTWVENAVNAGLSNGGLIYDTKAHLDADLAHDANSSAWVIGDSTAANNGIYRKSGASGAGSWTRVGDLPYGLVKLTDAGAGTANAIQLTSTIPTSDQVIRLFKVFEANTGDVTISENGGAAIALKTLAGNQVASGGLPAGAMVSYVYNGTEFRLLSDQASSAIQAAAEAAQAAAEAAQAAAETAAASATGAAPVADRAALKALSTSTKKSAIIYNEGGRNGLFNWDSSNLSAAVTADTQEAIYVAPTSDATGASGAWVREYDGPLVFQWFGLVGDETDESAIVQAIADLCIYLGDGTEAVPGTMQEIIGLATQIDIKGPLYFRGMPGDKMPSTSGVPSNTTPQFKWIGTSGATMFNVRHPDAGGRIGYGGITGFNLNGNSLAYLGIDVVQGYGFDTSDNFLQKFVVAGIRQIDSNATTGVAYANVMRDIQVDCGTDPTCYSMHGIWIDSQYNEGQSGVTNSIIENIRGNNVLGDIVRLRGTDTNYTTAVQAVPRILPLPVSTAVALDAWYYVQNRVYKVTSAGTTDTLANLPTHTTGAATNGTAELTYQGPMGGAVGFRNTTTKWAAGASVTTGDVRYYLRNVYVAASTGTTGSTAPTHTTGTVSDGGVNWTYSRQAFHTQKNPVMHLARGYAYAQEGTIGNVIVLHNGEGGGSVVSTDSTLTQLCIVDHITGAAFRSWMYELDDELALPLNTAYIVTGTPALGTGGSGALHQHYAFDAATTETIAWEVAMPPRWEDGKITRLRVRGTSSSGDVRLRFRVQAITTANGYNIALGGQTVDVTATVSTTYSVIDLPLVTPLTVTEGSMLHIEFSRLGTDAADTATGDFLLQGTPLIRFNGNGPDGNSYLGPWAITPRKLSY